MQNIAARRRFGAIYESFQEFSMVPRDQYVANLELAARVAGLPGCIIECGVWRGGMTAGIAAVLGTHRSYFLLDSFEGLPPARDIDGPAARKWQADTDSPHHYDNCSADISYARRAMQIAGVTNAVLVAGWFKDSLPRLQPTEQVALLRLDGDWYESTMDCLESLFPLVANGGLVVIDDYHVWDGCSRAVHDYLSKHGRAEKISCHAGVCYIEKRANVDLGA